MMRLNRFRAARTGFDRIADAFLIDIATYANDHANHLQCVRMIVKNDSQLQAKKVRRKKRVASIPACWQSASMTTVLMPLNERCVAYERMADALEHLGETWRDWPDLRTC